MKKLLHIIATPRQEESRTLQVAGAFLDVFKRGRADWVVEEFNVFSAPLPELTVKRVDGKYMLLGGKELFGDMKEAWEDIVLEIERFLSADGYLLSVPMWNFGVPYTLKHYLDVILQPKYLFRYTKTGVEGLVKNRKLVAVTSRGGEYTSQEMRPLDFLEPYLRAAFGFVGITDIRFINAQPMDMGNDVRESRLKEAQAEAREAAEAF